MRSSAALATAKPRMSPSTDTMPVAVGKGCGVGTSLQINKHVGNLSRYLPFDADFDQLFEEHADPNGAHVDLPTRAQETVAALVREGVALVILTGDAGHGKTHLCRRLLEEEIGMSRPEAFQAIRERSDGTTELGRTPGGRPLRIIKDLSEPSPSVAAARLVDSLSADGRMTICCANEGRLRVVLGERPDALAPIQEALDRALDGGAIRAGPIAILDLNHQAVAARGSNLVERLLQSWAVDGRRWTACASCSARSRCPIFANHAMLADQNRGPARRRAFAGLFRLVELGGATVTIRELLAATALSVTGGLTCDRVHVHVRRRSDDLWQAPHLYFEAAFGGVLSAGQRNRLRVLRPLGLLDPARTADRRVDDALSTASEEASAEFVPVESGRSTGGARTARDAQRAAEDHRRLIAFLRRRAFFDDEGRSPDLAERVGLRHASTFERIVLGDAGSGYVDTTVRDSLLRGLEAIQGVRRSGGDGAFFVVDPAFGSSGDARVVAIDIDATAVRVRPQSDSWTTGPDASAEIMRGVDWLERRVVVEFPDIEPRAGLSLDLLEFEFVMRCADGLTDFAFYEATVRRLRGGLARLATPDGGGARRRITVVFGNELYGLVIDVDQRIRAARGA